MSASPKYHHSECLHTPYEPIQSHGDEEVRQNNDGQSVGIFRRLFHTRSEQEPSVTAERSGNQRKQSRGYNALSDSTVRSRLHMVGDKKGGEKAHDVGPRPGAMPRPVGGSSKLGTFAGVFVPTSLNVLSILMFLRFGFILGQSGFLGMMGMLIACYLINLVTTLSISAIASNGTVRGGGAYYLISRSLGPEFGGSIGIVLYLGFVFNTGLNAVGLIDCLKQNFGTQSGNWSQWLPESFWWGYLGATVVLMSCTAVCLAGSGLFARCSNALLFVLLLSTFSIPVSTLFVRPFENAKLGIEYTGLSAQTFAENLLPRFTRGARGSQVHGKENFQDLFGILFPATGGIFAGASMSGDLKNPSRAIPRGTLAGLGLTFFAYSVVILAMAATITRQSFYRDLNVVQEVNISGILILLGEFSTTSFSVLMGVIGSAKLLQALARDHLLPGLSVFGQGTKSGDEPTYAIIVTYLVAQLTMLSDINQIASFVTMTYLMTFLVTNLACFLLKISSAPNFRPSFHYFNWWTAAIGTIVSGATMFFVDGVYASACVALLVVIFLIIHYTTPPKAWGDVSQSLIYHQVRKYLLRLRQEHVKFWRPQILLFVNDPRRSYKLIQFCNSLKKGALFVLGHVIVSQDFGGAIPEARKQQAAWTKYIDFSRIKAFVNIAISPGVEWGARNVVLSAGLGGMRPNIVVMGFYNLGELRQTQPLIDVPSPPHTRPGTVDASRRKSNGLVLKPQKRRSNDERMQGQLPTDLNREERSVNIKSYVTVLEDFVLRLQINLAIAKGFSELELPASQPSTFQRMFSKLHLGHQNESESTKKYIDLWPIQMSAQIAAEGGDTAQSILTTNFDTYTLILQLGCILRTVPAWRRAYKLRVNVFVEYETDVNEERGRVQDLLRNLRIDAEVVVSWLACGDLKTYEVIVNGRREESLDEAEEEADEVLKEEEWWEEVQQQRGRRKATATSKDQLVDILGPPKPSPQSPMSIISASGRRSSTVQKVEDLRKILQSRRRSSLCGLDKLGVSLSMRTHRLDPGMIDRHPDYGSASEDDHSDSESSSSESDGDAALESDEAASEPDVRKPDNIERIEGSTRANTIPFVDPKWLQEPSRPRQQSFNGLTNRVELERSTSKPALSPKGSSEDTRPKGVSNKGAAAQAQSLAVPRPSAIRKQSTPKFTSKPVPRTTISTEDGPGPSIMFTDQPSPPSDRRHRSIYTRSPGTLGIQPNTELVATAEEAYGEDNAIPSHVDDPSGTQAGPDPSAASYFPASASQPLSFNDLPSRAQHFILNELMVSRSADTAVLFTTLPAPSPGTSESEEDSVRYLSDLEVLCQGCPPCLLVHSNSMTVTTSL